MMSELTHKIQLTRSHRDVILKHGCVWGRLETSLRRWPGREEIRRVGITDTELHLLICDLMHAFNHELTGKDSRTVLELLDHLERAQLTHDGDLDILW